MDTRNTKQKELILETLKHDKSHPSIVELYKKIEGIDSSIGQATVYRNVNRLVEEGKIKKIPTKDIIRYDADCSCHSHLYCKKCQHLIDIYNQNHSKLAKVIEDDYQVKIESTNIMFEGICAECLEK